MKQKRTKTGILLVGLNGATASTLVAGSVCMANGYAPTEFGTTDNAEFQALDLLMPTDLVFGGWDFSKKNFLAVCQQHGIMSPQNLANLRKAKPNPLLYKGIHTIYDIPLGISDTYVHRVHDINATLVYLKHCIAEFKTKSEVDAVIVVYLGSPNKKLPFEMRTLDSTQLKANISSNHTKLFNSGILYAIASIESGCHFIDFTPNETLESPGLIELALTNKTQLAGRDGSTGQTMLKVMLADLFKYRNIDIQMWYSNNIIGNHDGYILNLPEFDHLKMHDKKFGLSKVLGYDFEHIVNIDYVKEKGDEKEAWDTIEFKGWMGKKMSMKINWLGADSFLASPIILDLIRLLEYGERRGLSGLQHQLGFFFKNPLGNENLSINHLYQRLVDFYTAIPMS